MPDAAGTTLDAVRATPAPRGPDVIARVQADVRAVEPGAGAHAVRFVLATAGGVGLAFVIAWFTHLVADNLFGGWDPPIRPRTLLLALCVPWAWLGVVLNAVQRPKQRAARAAQITARGELLPVAPGAGQPGRGGVATRFEAPAPGGVVVSPRPAVAIAVHLDHTFGLAFDERGVAMLCPVRWGR